MATVAMTGSLTTSKSAANWAQPPVQHIGKLLVVYRHNAEKAAAEAKKAQAARPSEPRRTKRSFQG